jgi:probable rRNA maturation factor
MPGSAATLVFRHPSRRVRRRGLGAFLRDLSAGLAGGRAVTCLITTDAEVRELNRRFLGLDRPTDVLAFPSGAGFSVGFAPALGRSPMGDLAISLDRAAAQAAELGHSLEQELRILILHGLLHLTGLDHHDGTGGMARAEARWRKRLGLPAGLIERTCA